MKKIHLYIVLYSETSKQLISFCSCHWDIHTQRIQSAILIYPELAKLREQNFLTYFLFMTVLSSFTRPFHNKKRSFLWTVKALASSKSNLRDLALISALNTILWSLGVLFHSYSSMTIVGDIRRKVKSQMLLQRLSEVRARKNLAANYPESSKELNHSRHKL